MFPCQRRKWDFVFCFLKDSLGFLICQQDGWEQQNAYFELFLHQMLCSHFLNGSSYCVIPPSITSLGSGLIGWEFFWCCQSMPVRHRKKRVMFWFLLGIANVIPFLLGWWCCHRLLGGMICCWLSFDKGEKYLLFSWQAQECSFPAVAITKQTNKP